MLIVTVVSALICFGAYKLDAYKDKVSQFSVWEGKSDDAE